MLRFIPRSAQRADFPCPEGMPPALHRLLAGRGVASAEEAEAFLNPGVHSLCDPLRLNDMAAAVARIRSAMEGGEAICVYGDYDVDGVCAAAILSGWLKSAGADAKMYLPSRHSEGYGLNEGAIREIAGWARLMVTVDCGVTDARLVALAKSLGLDVVVTDHHRPGEGALPDCPVVNPLLGGYPFPHLCGAGVAWKLVWALADSLSGSGERAAMARVDVAALATVADVVPLTGENRAIVRMGLDAINSAAPRPGIAALIESAGLSGRRIDSTAVAFQLAPRLNAGGRLGSAMRSLELVLEADPARARELAAVLEAENARRKAVEQQILQEAEAQLRGFDFAAHRAIILAGADWNPGVIGLAASRLVEKYNYPVVLLSEKEDGYTGSCRSIEGVDIHAALTGCADAILRFGGHRQAAGLTLLPGMLEPFRRAMDAWLWRNTDPRAYIPFREYDGPLDFGEVTPGLIAALEGLQPTGCGNPAPLFRAQAAVVEARAVGSEGAHLKLSLSQGGHRLSGIAFREGSRAEGLPGEVDALFVPKRNSYMGRVAPELELKALGDGDPYRRLEAKLGDEPRLLCEFLTEIIYNEKTVPFSTGPRDIDAQALREWMAASPQGTLVVVSGLACAGRLLRGLEGCPVDLVIGALPRDPRCFNAVCVCPASREVPAGYGRLVLAGVPAEYAPDGPEFCRLGDDPAWIRLLPDLDDMRRAYVALMRIVGRPAWLGSLWQLFHMTAEGAGMDDVTAAASVLTMADMGLFRLERDERSVRAVRSDRSRADPQDSAVWRRIQGWRKGI